MEVSACGYSHASEYIEPFYNLGYNGLIVTDHFFGGNVRPEFREGSWEEFVNKFCRGYELAKEAADAFNAERNLTGDEAFKVFFGFEQSWYDGGDDYLIYGLDKNWLLAHPECVNYSQKDFFDAVNEVGGLMIQAHPFRWRSYMNAQRQVPYAVHGVEVFNGGNDKIMNDLAELYAREFHFPMTSGSDIHGIDRFDQVSTLGGVIFDKPLKDIFDYAKKVKNFEGRII